LEAEPQDPDNSALSAGSHCRWRPFLLDTAANQIAARVREFMDMPKESIPGEEIMGTATPSARPPFPPFTRDSAMQKVRLAEDAWNTRDPAKVALAYTIDSRWRNRSEFINGRIEIIAFLSRKWAKELDYRLIKEMWAFTGNRIAVRFAYEWHDDSDHWYRSYGNENWEFGDNGLMASRFASIDDILILGSERKYHRVLGRRPDDHPGLSDLGL
jgi:nuclear transport factor 2 (NTF2) superfamily protein